MTPWYVLNGWQSHPQDGRYFYKDGLVRLESELAAAQPTLAEMRALVRAKRGEGVECPCCGQFAKVYRRKLASTMARSLVVVFWHQHEHPEAEWVDLTALLLANSMIAANTNAALLKHWGLLEPKGGVREDGSKRVGLHRITDLGRRFVRAEVRVFKYVFLYDEELLGKSDGGYARAEFVTIQEALGDRFNYSELMAG